VNYMREERIQSNLQTQQSFLIRNAETVKAG
jgi:hypothetical protein